MCHNLDIAGERWSRVPEPLSLFTVTAGIAAIVCLSVAWRTPGDFGVGLVMTAALIAAVPAALCAGIAFWPRLREPLVVLLNHAVVAFLLAYVLNPEVRFALTVAGVASVAGCVCWILICPNDSLKSNLNWVVAGAAAGVLFHPLFFSILLFSGEINLIQFVVWSCLSGLFFGLLTVAGGLLAATTSRLVLLRIQLWRDKGGRMKDESESRPSAAF